MLVLLVEIVRLLIISPISTMIKKVIIEVSILNLERI